MKKSQKLTISVSRTREVDAEPLTVSCSARVPATRSEIAANAPELQARLAATFQACREAVENELERQAGAAASPHVPRLGPPDAYYQLRDVTPEQLAELRRLADLAGTDLTRVLAARSAGIRTENLKMWQADDLITHLKALTDADPNP